ncbi:Hypothetical predicted protein, partial [Paramuricea clavata]
GRPGSWADPDKHQDISQQRNLESPTQVSNDAIATLIANQPPFKAGGLKDCVHAWTAITSDPFILDAVTHCHLEFDSLPESNVSNTRPYFTFNETEQTVIDGEIEKFLQKGIIRHSVPESGEVLSPIFITPKKDGTSRVIFNLKALNQFVSYHHFKMDTLDTAIRLMRPGCFMTSIDLKDAYYSIPIALEHQNYLKFIWRDKLYCFTCLPMEGSHAECLQATLNAVKLIINLGFKVHPDISVTLPSQCIEFLGFLLNSVTMTVTLTPDKQAKLIRLCQTFLRPNTLFTIRQVVSLIGSLVSSFPGVEFGPLHYRHIEMCAEDHSGQGNWNSCASTMDYPTNFYGSSQSVGRCSTDSQSNSPEPGSSHVGQSSSTSGSTEVYGMQVIRRSLCESAIPTDIINTIMHSWRDSTHKQYGNYINKWLQFCVQGSYDPLHPTIKCVLMFLHSLYNKGISYSSLNTARSAISNLCFTSDMDSHHVPIGKHFLICRYLKGVFNEMKPVPKYHSTWPVYLVLDYLSTLWPLEKLSLKELTLNLVTLIALTTGQRCQTLTFLDISTDYMSKTDDPYRFALTEHVKQDRPGK